MSLVPNKFLSDYADEQKCEELLKETSVHPLRFGPRRTRSEKELGTWLSDISQGRGDEGTVLYRKCTGKCSPRYLLDMAGDGDGFVANLDVVCGPARDRTDNTYAVASGYRWACRAGRLMAGWRSFLKSSRLLPSTLRTNRSCSSPCANLLEVAAGTVGSSSCTSHALLRGYFRGINFS